MLRPTKNFTTALRLTATTALAIAVLASPISIDFDPDGGVSLTASKAMAKSGSGRDGDRDRDDDDRGGNSGRDNDRGGDRSRSNDRDDDRGGNRDRGRDRDDDHRDESRSNNSRDDSQSSNSNANRNDDRARGRDRDDRGPRAEIQGNNIEVTFADGTKQEIEFGRFEQKDAFGNTIAERPATPTDRARLEAAAANLGRSISTTVGTGGVAKTETFGQNIEVNFTDGTKQEIEAGRLEVKDQFGSTIIERPATAEDFSRLSNGVSTLQ